VTCPGCQIRATTPKKGVCGLCWGELTAGLKLEWWDIEEETDKKKKQKDYFAWVDKVKARFKELEKRRAEEG